MGSAKLPEQISARIEDARREAEEGTNPHIEKLRAMPVERKIEPEEVNVRRAVSPGGEKGARTIAKKMVALRQLKAAHEEIGRLKTQVQALRAENETLARKVEILRAHAKRQEEKIEQLEQRDKPDQRR